MVLSLPKSGSDSAVLVEQPAEHVVSANCAQAVDGHYRPGVGGVEREATVRPLGAVMRNVRTEDNFEVRRPKMSGW